MLGPIFHQELLMASRRRREELHRRWYTGVLVLGFIVLVYAYEYQRRNSSWPTSFGDYAEPFVQFLLTLQFLLIILATPAYTAGAITDEKSRGTLQYLFTAGVTTWEILLGKLFGRAAHVGQLALTALPILCFLGVFAGVGPLYLLMFFAALAMPLVAAGAAGLLASVWCRTTRDAVLAVYLAGLGLALALRFLGWLGVFDPFEVIAPAGVAASGADLLGRLAVSAAAWGGVAALCLGVATWRLRPAYLHQLGAVGARRSSSRWQAARPAVRHDPVAWKERYVEGIAPLVLLRAVPRGVGMAAVFLAAAALCGSALWEGRRPGTTLATVGSRLLAFDLPGLQGAFPSASNTLLGPNLLMILFASLFVGVRASGAVTGERERQTWENLLVTPLTARQLVRGKLWGILGSTYPYLAAYAVPALLVALAGGWWPLLLTASALAGAWFGMGVVGAIGLWCSVRSRGSWRSLVSVLFVGSLVGGLGSGWFLMLLSALVALLRYVLWLYDLRHQTSLTQSLLGHPELFGLLFFVALGCLFLAASPYFLHYAQKQLARGERVRYWPNRNPFTAAPRRGKVRSRAV